MSTYCKCYHCGAEDGIDIDDGVCSECGYPDRVIEDLKAEAERLRDEYRVAVSEGMKAIAEAERLRKNLANLHALVIGECPSLLDEDRGGDAKLDDEIRAALAGKE